MDLGLQAIANKEFYFLRADYNFKCVKAGPWLVKYESNAVFLNIHFDGNRSFELGCELGRKDGFKGTLEVPFDLGEIIRCKEHSDTDIQTAFQVTNSETLQKCCNLLATHLKNYAHEFLIGANETFNQAADFRNRECDDYAFRRDLDLIRSELGDAWQNRDYNKVIELLFPYKEWIEHSELKKLDYALKRKKE